ncbi:MAG TPA: alpha/beta fold hydrolase [Burkholderiaceae bacterium]|jgi:predicted dienelactone hydrolase|nr:alpha/beta fold hydrolase [Burkholderiaceae bacterium]
MTESPCCGELLPNLVRIAALMCAIASSSALAADCTARQAAGYRVLAMENGRKVAVWYPAAASEQPLAYSRATGGFMGSVAKDAPPSACPRVPLVLFSHGLGGCALQSLFLTEELARHGYVVAAPDHKDAVCAIGSDEHNFANMRTDQSFLEPERWSERSHRDRLLDLRTVIDLVENDQQLGPAVDAQRIGLIGHSLGGYTTIGMAGAWPSWKHTNVKAVLALSPYVLPFITNKTLARLDVPVMYQGAQFDWGITTSLEGAQGAYALTAAPKYFVKLKGGTHLEWANLLCSGQPNVVACLKAKPNAYLIDRYGIEFLDRYLKNKPSALLAGKGLGLDVYRFELP